MKEEFCILAGILGLISAVEAAADAVDSLGDALPKRAVQRLGNMRMRYRQVGGLAYLPDGRGVVLTADYVDIWDLAKGQHQSRTKLSPSALTTVQLRPGGKVLLIGDAAGKVYEWDFEKLAAARQWDTGQGGLQSACYSADGARLLIAGSSPPGLMEFSIQTGEKITDIRTPGFATTRCGAIYGPAGKTAIMGGGYDHLLEHRDLATGKLLHKWGTNYESKDIKLSPDGACVLVGVESHAKEWKLADYSLLHRYDAVPGEAGRCYALDYAPRRNEAVCGLRTGSIHRWDRGTGKEVFSWVPHTGCIFSLCVSPDCQWVLSHGAGLLAETNMDTGKPRVQWDRHHGGVQAAAFLPSANRVVSGSSDATLRVWDIAAARTVLLIPGAKLGAYALAVSPDGQRVAAGCKDGVVRVFSLVDGKLLRELDAHRGYVRSVAYTHDGTRLLSSADDGSICVWQADCAEPRARLEGHRGGVLAVAVSPDDKLALSGGRDGTVRVWDIPAGKLLHTYKGHRGWVHAVAFAGGGRWAISTGTDRRLLRWDLESGELAADMDSGWIYYALACSPDGLRAYGAGNSFGITCWDLRSAKKVAEFRGHQHVVYALAVSPDGKVLVTGSHDTTLLVWNAP